MASINEVIDEFVSKKENSLDKKTGIVFDFDFETYCLGWGVTDNDVAMWAYMFSLYLMDNKTYFCDFERYRIMHKYLPRGDDLENIEVNLNKNFTFTC